MKKYNNEDYFSVIDKRTGRKICDCSEYSDAMMMVRFDLQNRVITTNKNLMGQVVDVDVQKQLPSNNIVVNMEGGVGGSWRVDESSGNGPGQLPQIKLPEGQGIPVKV